MSGFETGHEVTNGPSLPVVKDELTQESRNASYVLRHWRGELPLWRSYWVNGSLVTLASVILVSVAIHHVINEWLTRFWKSASILIILIWVAIYLVTIWQIVGIWRSAQTHVSKTGSFLWARVAQLMMIVTLTMSAHGFATVAWPQITEYSLVALGIQNFGGYAVQVSRQGTEMKVAGAMDFGLTEEVKRQLNAHPGVSVIHLNSRGGRMAEARSLRQIIQSRGLNTYTSKGCFSACAHAFLAGTTRVLESDGLLGFHQAHFPGLSSKFVLAIMKEEESYFLSRGVPTAFIKKAFSTSSDRMWTPSPEELLAAHVVTRLFTVERSDPRNGLERDDEGMTLYYQKRFEEAVPVLEATARRYPDHIETKVQLGDALVKTGHPEQALRWFNEVLAKQPDHLYTLHCLGHALFIMNRYQEAIAPLHHRVQLAPEVATHHADLGWALISAGRTAEGLGELKEAAYLGLHGQLEGLCSPLRT